MQVQEWLKKALNVKKCCNAVQYKIKEIKIIMFLISFFKIAYKSNRFMKFHPDSLKTPNEKVLLEAGLQLIIDNSGILYKFCIR